MDKFRREKQGGHMAFRRPHRFHENVLCSILSNGSLANQVFVAMAAVAVFDSGSAATI